jgi:hypothetical protein
MSLKRKLMAETLSRGPSSKEQKKKDEDEDEDEENEPKSRQPKISTFFTKPQAPPSSPFISPLSSLPTTPSKSAKRKAKSLETTLITDDLCPSMSSWDSRGVTERN